MTRISKMIKHHYSLRQSHETEAVMYLLQIHVVLEVFYFRTSQN